MPLKEGTRIKFNEDLTQGPTGETPAFIFAEKGGGGEIVRETPDRGFDYLVKWDGFHRPFYCNETVFEVEE